MGFRQKSFDSEELLRTVKLAQRLLDELISLINDILRLMEQLDMENTPAYREYQEALPALQQLQHTNEETRSKATCYQMVNSSLL